MYAKERRRTFRLLKRARIALYTLYRRGAICEAEYRARVRPYDRWIDRMETDFYRG